MDNLLKAKNVKEYCYYITKKVHATCLTVNVIHLKHIHNLSKAFIAGLSIYYKNYI